MNERKAMLTSQTGLSVTRPCQLLAVPRASAYARAQPVSSVALALMRLLDERYLKWPLYGSRRLMQQMGWRVSSPKPWTSQAGKGHKIYPDRRRELPSTRPNQVWASAIGYIQWPRASCL